MRQLVNSLVAAIVVLLVAAPVFAQLDPRLFRTEDLMVIYLDENNEYILPHLSRCFINSLDFHKELFDYEPSEAITVLLQDFDDYGYAGASSMPSNFLSIGIEPFEYVYETSPTNERINWVMSHELLHIVAMDKPAPGGSDGSQVLLGKVAAVPEQPLSMIYSYLTTPGYTRLAGTTRVWQSSWRPGCPGGYGRALGGYDEMVFRTMVPTTTTSTITWGWSPRARPSTSRSAVVATCTEPAS